MDKSIRTLQKFLQRHPSSTSSENEVEELPGEGTVNVSTMETMSTKCNTVLSIPSKFPGETFPSLNPENTHVSYP